MRLKHPLTSFFFPLAYFSCLLALLPAIKCQQPIRDAVVQTPLDPSEDLAYIRIIFANGTEQYVRNWECPDGLWSEEMFATKQQPRCLCVKGIFAISKELCDETFEIITGDEHCYDIGTTKIRKISPLTGQGGLKGRANTVFRKDGSYFARLISPTPTSTVLEPVDYILRLNDPTDFSIYASATPEGYAARLGCIPGQFGAAAIGDPVSSPVIQIAKLPGCSNEFRGPQPWCLKNYTGETPPATLTYTAAIKVGSKWSTKGTGAGSPYPGSCRSLTGKNRGGPGGRRTGRKKRAYQTPVRRPPVKPLPVTSVTDDPKYCETVKNTSTKDPPQIGFTSPIEYFVDRTPYTIHTDFKTWENYQKDVNEQTQKIMRNVLDYHLGEIDQRNDSKIKLVNPSRIDAFRYVQISRIIIEKVCPQEQVPTFVLAFMIRLFRIILLDLQEKHKYSEFLLPGSQVNNDILQSLTECKDQAKPINFMNNATCPSQGVYATNDTVNDTNVFFKDINLTMPQELKWTSGSVDFPLETVWKMMAFVHYYCASYFPNPVLHSQYVVKYEEFFNNPSALFRWYNPGPANKLIRALLPTYDLSVFAKSVDLCVSTAREMSAYKGWLRRPADGLAFYQKRFDISKYTTAAPLINKGRSGNAGRLASLSRQKRHYAQNNIWQGQAYCLRNSKSILTDIRSSSIYQCKIRPAWFHNTDYYFY